MIRKLACIVILLFMGTRQLKAQEQDLKITVGSTVFFATLYDNPTANAFAALLPLTANMSELGGIEKYFYLEQNLPGTPVSPGNISAGELMIYSSNCLVLFYTTHSSSYSYISIGHINDITGLTNALGNGSVQVTYELYDSTMGFNSPPEIEEGYTVFPNPAVDYISIRGNNFRELLLMDINGVIVSRSNSVPLDTRNLSNGVYLLAIETENRGTIHKKIVIKK